MASLCALPAIEWGGVRVDLYPMLPQSLEVGDQLEDSHLMDATDMPRLNGLELIGLPALTVSPSAHRMLL